jgi:hypothetical protein
MTTGALSNIVQYAVIPLFRESEGPMASTSAILNPAAKRDTEHPPPLQQTDSTPTAIHNQQSQLSSGRDEALKWLFQELAWEARLEQLRNQSVQGVP